MNYYCTLFDSNYLTRGLALYQSLVNVHEDFHLFIFPFDNLARDILREFDLPRVTIVPLKDFESPELLAVKPTRTPGEYCWTCTAASILFTLENFDIPEVTYLDSDLFFFDKPSIILDEFHRSGKDVMITRHNYTSEYDQTATSGVYCVQFMTFKANANALKILRWWKDRCVEWCYARFENGKFGDQKYLDDWTERFNGVHVMQNSAAGLAPWNIQQYICKPGPTVNSTQAIFYHFHNLKWIRTATNEGFATQGFYKLSDEVMSYIYQPYFHALQNSLNIVRQSYDKDFIKGIVWPDYNLW